MKLKLAVVGKDVSKSESPKMHTYIANAMGNSVSYEKISVSEEHFAENVEKLFELDGFNVTIPYKLSIIPYLKKLCGDAEAFGAVNTVKTKERYGYNTDGMGFSLMLENNGVCVDGKKALVLGAGGAGRSVAKKLADSGAEVFVYDIRREDAEKVASEFDGVKAVSNYPDASFYLIVNATGVGMHKTVGISPVSEDILKNTEVAVDLIYTPAESRFLQIAKSLGKKTINGEGMLFYQAYFAQCIYFGVTPDGGQAKQLFLKYKEIK